LQARVFIEGNFEIRDLMRSSTSLPMPKLRTVIDRGLVHRIPGRAVAHDIIAFE
jgi:hypothetical protein